MADPVKWGNLIGFKEGGEDTVTIEAICPTGFEEALLLEIREKFGEETRVIKHQGRVFFDLPLKDAEKVVDLRIVDNAFVLVYVQQNCDFSTDKEDSLTNLAGLLRQFNWRKGLLCWNRINKFYPGTDQVLKEVENFQKTEDEVKNARNGDVRIPTFRCTCYRSGENHHSFTSMDAAKHMGGLIEEMFKWKVQMKDADIDVTVNIDLNQVYCSLKLTKKSLFYRNIVSLGRTTLRATICAGLLRLAKVKPGEIVVDPMSGSGSIPLEGCVSFKNSYFFGGEIHGGAVQKCNENLEGLCSKNDDGKKISIPSDFVRWDVTNVPLRDDSVDVFVSDLPFGKRSGTKSDNRVLYPKIMISMAKAVRRNTGRAVLLTNDRTSMIKMVGKYQKYWKTHRHYSVNIGGLSALVFIMSRTNLVPE